MKDLMQYKNYWGHVHYSDEDRIFYGQIAFIRALVSYEGRDVDDLRQAFEEAVDDYLAFCTKRGTAPEQPLKGSFNVRIGHELHLRAAIAAARDGTSLNHIVMTAIDNYLPNRPLA